MINELEFDLKRKMNSLGIQLSREQIRVMTTRVDGDDLAKIFAIFDVTRQISDKLRVLVKKNYFTDIVQILFEYCLNILQISNKYFLNIEQIFYNL